MRARVLCASFFFVLLLLLLLLVLLLLLLLLLLEQNEVFFSRAVVDGSGTFDGSHDGERTAGETLETDAFGDVDGAS